MNDINTRNAFWNKTMNDINTRNAFAKLFDNIETSQKVKDHWMNYDPFTLNSAAYTIYTLGSIPDKWVMGFDTFLMYADKDEVDALGAMVPSDLEALCPDFEKMRALQKIVLLAKGFDPFENEPNYEGYDEDALA